MTFINYAAREINCKIVYYGPGLCGKTTNLQWIYDKTNPQAAVSYNADLACTVPQSCSMASAAI